MWQRRFAVLAAVAALTGGSYAYAAGAVDQVDRAAEVSDRAERVAPPAGPTPPAQRAGSAMLDLVNVERRVRGMTAFEWHPRVAEAAEAHAADMAAHRRMSHTGSDGSSAGTRLRRAGFDWSAWGETIGAGFDRAEPLLAGWMNSPGHRAILLGEFRYVGVAAVASSDGTPYWALVVAS